MTHRCANSRIGYIVDRARFALDLELMEIDTTGFWPQIDDPDYQPEANLEYPENAGPTYGDIPRFLLVSREIREMLDAPLPGEEPETEAEAPFTRDGEPRSDP